MSRRARRGTRVLALALSVTLLIPTLILRAPAESEPYRSVKTSSMKIALTFDDGPHPKQTRRILEILDRYDVIYDCYRENWGWMTAAFKKTAAEYATNEHYLRTIYDFRKDVPELKAHLAAAKGPSAAQVQKVMLFARNDRPADILKDVVAEVNAKYPEIKATASTWNNVELNISSATKGNALRRFAESFGHTLANCMAFGDGMNDLSMIEAAGTGVAMANAVPEVKAAADYITLSNDECGVSAALRHFGL